MKRGFKTAHLVAGVVTTAIFLLTGLYMLLNFPDLYRGEEAVRMAIRANHVYILFAGLLNLAFGLYFQRHELRWKRMLQTVGSLLLLIAPPLLILAFFYEPLMDYARRPLTVSSVFFLLGGVVLHLIASYLRKTRQAMFSDP